MKNTLIDFYGNFFDIENAKAIYDTIVDNHKTIVTFGAMMESYCNCRMNTECIQLFKQIESINGNVTPNNICYAIVFKACTQENALNIGQEIHERLKNNEDKKYLLDDPLVQCNLIDMYSKCGSLSTSQALFDEIVKNKKKK